MELHPSPSMPAIIISVIDSGYVSLSLLLIYSLPYRMVFAVAGLDSVLFYDTQHSVPFAFVSNIHYAGITDMTWQV